MVEKEDKKAHIKNSLLEHIKMCAIVLSSTLATVEIGN